MAFTPDARRRFLELLPELAPDTDRTQVNRFLEAHRDTLNDELAAAPGHDGVRCGLLRAARDWLPAAELAEARQIARTQLEAFVDLATGDDPVPLLHRHPAWVGLARLELVDTPGPSDLDDALVLASAGFEGLTGGLQLPGDVLWAMAEAADEAGWGARAADLLDEAVTAAFADPDDRYRVRLLRGLSRLERGLPDAADHLREVAADDDAPEASRVHALWVLAALAQSGDDPSQRRVLLKRALGLVDDEEEDVRAKLQAALAEATD